MTALPRTSERDGELVGRCRQGDEEAWAILVGRYEQFVYSIARAEGLNPDDAGDVAQFTFTALLSQLDAVRDPDRLRWWLGSVSRRRAWRVRARHRFEFVDDLDEGWLEPTADTVDDFVRAVALHDALDRLGDPCRQLLTLLYLDPTEPTYDEVAARLGRSANGVGPARSRCLDRLRSIMTEGDR